MTKEVIYKKWVFEVDYERTKEVYDKIEVGSPESCSCNDCLNFSKNRIDIYPNEIKELLTELGIDYTKETEIYHICRLENGLHQYGGWFHFKGKISNGKNCKISYPNGGNTFDTFQVTEYFEIAFIKGSNLSFFDKEEFSKLVQVEFITETEWIIDKKLESE